MPLPLLLLLPLITALTGGPVELKTLNGQLLQLPVAENTIITPNSELVVKDQVQTGLGMRVCWLLPFLLVAVHANTCLSRQCPVVHQLPHELAATASWAWRWVDAHVWWLC